MHRFRNNFSLLLAIVLAMMLASGLASAQTKKPNILVIFGDDVGQANISTFSKGLMGYHCRT